jgi:hypothetical protein
MQASGLERGGTTCVNPWRPLLALLLALLAGLLLPAAQAAQSKTVNHGISAGTFIITCASGDYSTANATNTLGISINDFRPGTATLGTYNVQIGPVLDDVTNGIMMASVTENGRNNGWASTNNTFPTPAIYDASTTQYRILAYVDYVNSSGAYAASLARSYNVNLAGAWFPYSKYIGALVRNSNRTNGGMMDFMISSPQLVLGTHVVSLAVPDGSGGIAAGGGQFTIDLTSLGINSQTDGILLVTHGKAEGNFALSQAQTDGTWKAFIHDHGTPTAGSYEQDPLAFVYVSRTNTDVISGKFNGDGSIAMYSGASPQFTVTPGSAGRWTLRMNDYAATNGVLIVSCEGGGTYNLDNIVSYQVSADGQTWQVQSRDTPADGLQTPYGMLNGVAFPEPVCSFVFIPAPLLGYTVTPTKNLLTTEAGGTATFTVALNAKPTANVTNSITSSNTAEGTVSTNQLVFTPANWYLPQTVTVTGVDDLVADGEVAYTIVIGAGVSADPRFNGLKPDDVQALNLDNEAGISINKNQLTTTESGGTDTFTVVLNTAPTADVTIGLSSSDLTEGTVSPSSLTFTSSNWSTPQTVTVTGVDDPVVDGNVTYTIITAPAVSADPIYNAVDAMDVSVVNMDNDVAGLNVSTTGPLIVSETGTTASFTVALAAQPAANVTVTFTSSDTTEGTVSPASRTFTPANWSTPQSFTLTGVDDFVSDGTISYTLNGTSTSTDAGYNGLTKVIAARTLDNEAALTLPSGTLYYGIGWPGLGIDGAATIVDASHPNYNSGSLTVALTVNSTSSDRLEIRNDGTGAGQIGVAGSTVSYGGTAIGTYSGGVGTSPLVVALNASATPTAAQALVRNFTYRSVTNTPVLLPRTVVVTLADGVGGTSAASKQIVVSELHVCDFQQGKDAGFGTYIGAKDCELNAIVPDDYLPSGSVAAGIQLGRAVASGNTPDQEGLLRFDDIIGTNPGQIPPGAIIVQADLMLNLTASGSGSPMHRMKVAWDDPTTWNIMGSGVQLDDVEAESNWYSAFGIHPTLSGSTGIGQMRVSVLPDVQAWASGTNNYGWVMPAWTNETKTSFSPSEAANIPDRPRLVVTWMTPQASIKMASFRQGVNGYTNTMDTRIRQVSPTTTYATVTSYASDFEVTAGLEDNEQVLLRFDNLFGMGAGQVPPKAKIHAAVLDLNSNVGSGPGDGATINRMLIPWMDTTATWNFFVDGIAPDGVKAAAAPTATAGNITLDPNVTAFTEFDLTADVQLWANGAAPNYGWVFLPWPYGGDGWGIWSSKAPTVSNRPQLRVYYTFTGTFMLTPIVSPTSVQVKFVGEIGKTYTVVRRAVASGTGALTTLGTATVDEGGTATYLDNSPLQDAAFYQVHD